MQHSEKNIRILLGALLVCALVGGCAEMPRTGPPRQAIFVQPPAAPPPQVCEHPRRVYHEDDVAVTLSPGNSVSPVGKEVILIAGVVGGDNYLRTNRRLEWSLSPGGTGQFVSVGRNGPVDLLVGDFNRPRKIDNTFAIGSTSRKYLCLTRGTPHPGDDVRVLRGQGWISVASPVEGTSHVTVYAPSVRGWPCHTRTATIHWIDAAWQLPPPAINPAGTAHTLTTTVERDTDQEPCEGWLVRYEIVGGPAAGFTPDGSPAIEVTTDSAGRASAEIFQKEPKPGVSRIAVQIIRPAAKGGPQGKRLVVGGGYTTKTWTAPDLAIRKFGPAIAGLNTTATYRIEVSNPGDMPTEDVVVTDELPAMLTYLDADPPAEKKDAKLQWSIGRLGAGEKRTIQLNCRVTQRGNVVNSASATGKGNLTARDSATTTVETAKVQVQISGPPRVAVGENVTFTIAVTNQSQVPTGELVLKDDFGAGLKHAVGPSPIKRKLGSLAPGQRREVHVTFQVTRPGRFRHGAEVSDPDGILGKAEGWVTGVTSPGSSPPAGTGASRPGVSQRVAMPRASANKVGAAAAPFREPVLRQPAVRQPGRPSISVTKIGPKHRRVGEIAKFTIDVTNNGNQPLTKIAVVDNYDAAMFPTKASEGGKLKNNSLVWILDRLSPGQVMQLDVHCECRKETPRARNAVTVQALEGVAAEHEAHLEIAAAAGKLEMVVGGLHNPIRLEKELTYEVLISNKGTTPDSQVVLVAIVPPGMRPVRIGTGGPVQFKVEGQTVRFDPLAQIDPGEKISYRIRVKTMRPGNFKFRTELTSQNQPQRAVAEEATDVFD